MAPFSRIQATATEVSSPPENAIPTRSPTGKLASTLDMTQTLEVHLAGLLRVDLISKSSKPQGPPTSIPRCCRTPCPRRQSTNPGQARWTPIRRQTRRFLACLTTGATLQAHLVDP